MNTKMFWIHALSPLHVGTGQGLGFIDLPIMREKTTNWPLVPGSAIKGVIADYFKADDEAGGKEKSLLGAAFGKAGDDNSNSGALVFTDARLVCLPVRSLYGTFAWVTSPLALNRLKRDLGHAGETLNFGLPELKEGNTILLPDMKNSALQANEKVYFEDLDFAAGTDPAVEKWGEVIAGKVFSDDAEWKNSFLKRFAVLPDDSFDFLCEIGTEVSARICIEQDTKTVKPGALWYEESLPTESILSGIVWCDWVPKNGGFDKNRLMNEFCSDERLLQIGGKATTGKGRVRLVFDRGGTSHE